MGKITVRFGNGILNGGQEVWEFITFLIPETYTIESVTSRDGIWEVVVNAPEPEPDQWECTEDCYKYMADADCVEVPCSHCRKVTRKQRDE